MSKSKMGEPFEAESALELYTGQKRSSFRGFPNFLRNLGKFREDRDKRRRGKKWPDKSARIYDLISGKEIKEPEQA